MRGVGGLREGCAGAALPATRRGGRSDWWRAPGTRPCCWRACAALRCRSKVKWLKCLSEVQLPLLLPVLVTPMRCRLAVSDLRRSLLISLANTCPLLRISAARYVVLPPGEEGEFGLTWVGGVWGCRQLQQTGLWVYAG